MFIGVSTAISAIRRVSESFIRDGLKLYYRFTESFNESQPELLLSGATSFDGNDYINTGTPFSNTNHTISAWVNASATGGVVFDNRDANDDGIRLIYDSSLIYQVNSSDVSLSSPSLNTWHHIACTYDGTTQKLYLNGSLVASASTSQTVSVSQNLLFGKQSYSDVAYFNGSLANVGIWNRALSLSEIESIYWKGQYADLKGTELTNLVSWYNLKETGYGSEIVTGTDSDMSGSNNWATQLGSPTFNVNSTVADRLYINFSSGNQSVKLPNVFTPSLAYKVTLKARLNSGTATTVQFGSEFTSGSVSGIGKNIIPSSTLTEYTVDITSASTADLSIGIINALNNGSDYEFVDVKVQEVVSPDSTGTNNGSIYGATTLTDAYSASSPFLPRIQDKATPKGAVALASGSTSFATDDFVNLGQPSNLNFDTDADDFTIAMWFKIASGDTGTLICKGGDTSGDRQYHIYYSSSDYIAVNIGGTVVNTNAYDDGNWHHVAVVNFDDSGTQKFRIYIDGSSVGLGTSGSGSNSLDVLLGARRGSSNSNTAFLFDGSIANVAIYSDAKTQSQIQDIMFSSYSTLTSALKTNLVSWYDLGSTEYGSPVASVPEGGNGSFAYSDGTWTFASNVTYTYDNSFTQGLRYRLTYTIATYTSGSINVSFSNGTDQGTERSAVGTYTEENEISANANWYFQPNSFVGTITNVTLEEVLATDSQGDNEGSIYGATTNTGYTSSPSGVADPLNYGEVYGGNAVSFDGASDYISVADSSDLELGTSDFSFSFWMNLDDVSGTQTIFNRRKDGSNSHWIQVKNTGYLDFGTSHGGSSVIRSQINSAIVSANKWYHIVWSVDRDSTTNIYIDGLKQTLDVNTKDDGANTLDYGVTALIGGFNHSSPSSLFDGSMSGFKYFKGTALTQDQVRQLYIKPELTLPTGIASSALKLDMPMQEGSGTAILDGSGNQNHGTGSGITWANGQEYGFQHPLVRSNNPMVFDGSDDKVAVGTPSALNNIFTAGGTLSAWINPKSDGQNNAGQAFDKAKYAFQVIGESSGNVKVQFAVALSGGAARWETPLSVPLNTWTHILVTYDSDNPTTDPIIYLNGSAVTLTETIAPSGTHVSDASSNLILGNQDDGVTTFDGLLNDLAIWSSTLTANEATSLYNSGLPLLPTTDSGNYASSDDLVGYWRNDGVTTWLDRSTNSNNGTVSGSPASIIVPEGLNEGRDSQGYYLTDTDSISSGIRFKGAEYINVQDSESLDFANAFTIETWIKPKQKNVYQIFLQKGTSTKSPRLNIAETNGRYTLDIVIGSSHNYVNSTNDAVIVDQWQHLAVTWNGSTAKMYIDGSQNATASISGTQDLNTDPLTIGKSSSAYFTGSLDEVRLYSKELSASEVLKNYNNGKSAH